VHRPVEIRRVGKAENITVDGKLLAETQTATRPAPDSPAPANGRRRRSEVTPPALARRLSRPARDLTSA